MDWEVIDPPADAPPRPAAAPPPPAAGANPPAVGGAGGGGGGRLVKVTLRKGLPGTSPEMPAEHAGACGERWLGER